MAGKIKRGSALAAACLLLFLTAVPREAYGAVAVETERDDCSMKFSLSNDYGELADRSIPVAVYRIASIRANGTYEPANGYGGIGLDKVNSATTAAEWAEIAKKAAGIAAPGVLDEDGRITAKALPAGSDPDETVGIGTGASDTQIIGDLETGMYLVLALAVDTPEYTCSFAPYLVSVPGNGYYGDGDDTWIYDVDVTLKPDRTERFGSLEITKALSSFRAGDAASFIFQVEAVKEVDGVLVTVYSDVVQLSFDAPGNRSLLIEERIPAGSTVTVTEIYKGAAYDAQDGDVRTVPVAAEETASADFTNAYNGQLNGGSSIVNNFQPTVGMDAEGNEIVENWMWTQIQD